MIGNYFNTVIIGGGFYGLRIAQYLKEELGINDILVIEIENDVMQRASLNNQARVHNGYHYPRSVLTALRSRVNLPVFLNEYKNSIELNYDMYYGVATKLSKVSARQFERFFERIGAEISPAKEVAGLFNPKMIEEVYKVQEYVFDSVKIKNHLTEKLQKLGVQVHTNEKVQKIAQTDNGILIETDKSSYTAKHVLNTTYSSINAINDASGLPIIPLKHEVTEMCLVDIPPELEGKSFTIMCGPFFSLMPFPSKNKYSLSHVRYTPHGEWHDKDKVVADNKSLITEQKPKSNFPLMIADMRRYMPIADQIKYTGESLWEIKTVLPQSEGDDSRPILFLENHGGLKNYTCIMGGKIDNIYDVFKELKISYDKND